MSVEGRTHKPVVNHKACNSCSVCFRACPAELTVGLRKDEESLCGIVYGSNSRENSIASDLDTNQPPCQLACPLNQDVRGYISHIAEGNFQKALEVILETNPLPAVCGYVCHRPCESACIKKHLFQAVPIRALKRFVSENYEIAPKPIVKKIEEDVKVAIVGSGPAGLTAAFELVQNGIKVEVFESESSPGGLLTWAIPEFRLPSAILQKEIDRLIAYGVKIHTDVTFGNDLTFEELQNQGFKAVILATGAMESLELNSINGQEIQGFTDCLTVFKDAYTKGVHPMQENVLVIGGGNAAMDIARKAYKLGAKKVTVVYRRDRSSMPADAHEIEAALNEGVLLEEQSLPVKVLSSNGVVTGLRCIRTMMVESSGSSRRIPMVREGTEFELEADTIITAVGQKPDFEQVIKGLPKKPGWEGSMKLNDGKSFKKIPGLFMSGDFANGSSTIVEAMASGKKTANGVLKYLTQPSQDFIQNKKNQKNKKQN